VLCPVHPFASSRHFPQGSVSLDSRVASLPYESSSLATSRGNEKIGGTGYCVTYDTDSQSRNVLASPLGEEGHEVAKGVQANWIHRGAPRPANPVRRHPAKSVWTRVRMIMILDVDVTAEGGIIKLIARRAIPPPFEPSGPCEPSHRRCVQCCSPTPSSRAGLRVGMGADGNRSDDTLSREISCLNAARAIRGGDFSTPLRYGRNDGGCRPAFLSFGA
jgi:hypothetical protein